MNNKVYIYGLSGDDGIIRYVGKSIRPNIRKLEHLSDSRTLKTNKHKAYWIRKILRDGNNLNVNILEECNEDNWSEREIYWIAQFNNLTNKSAGGEFGGYKKYKLPFDEVRTWVLTNLPDIKTETQWREYIKINQLPEFIPRRPNKVYSGIGWVSFTHFFDKKYKVVDFMGFEQIKSLIEQNNILTRDEYRIYRDNNKHLKLPYDPTVVFSNDCKYWSDLLPAKEYKEKYINKNKQRKIVDFETAKNLVKNENFTKKVEYVKYVKENLTLNLPWDPIKTYRGEWVSWQDFFGNENERIVIYKGGVKRKHFLSYYEAKIWVNKNYPGLSGENKWRKITSELPIEIPKRPDNVYKNNGWVSWAEFFKKITT
jgi:hypothetical protein